MVKIPGSMKRALKICQHHLTRRLLDSISHQLTPNVKSCFLLVCALCFVAGLSYSIYTNRTLLANVRPVPALLIPLTGVLPTIVLGTVQFVINAKALQNRVSFLYGIEIFIIGSAANMLPIPGGAVVRIVGLQTSGSDYKKSTQIILTTAALQLGLSLTWGGLWCIAISDSIVGPSALVGGILSSYIAAGYYIHLSHSKTMCMLLALSMLLALCVDAWRIALSYAALSFPVAFGQTAVLAMSTILGSVISIIPAGLGIREMIASALAPAIKLEPTQTFLAIAVNRIMALITVVPIALFLSLSRNRETKKDGHLKK